MLVIGIPLRVLLLVGSLCTAAFILRRIRYAKVQIEDSIFWLFFSAFLLLLSIFPEAASWAARMLPSIWSICSSSSCCWCTSSP